MAESAATNLNIPERAAQGDVPADIGMAILLARLKDDATIEAHGLTHINCVKQILEYGNTISCDGLGDLEKFAWGLPTRSPLRIRLGNLRLGRLTSNRIIRAVGTRKNVALAILKDSQVHGCSHAPRFPHGDGRERRSDRHR